MEIVELQTGLADYDKLSKAIITAKAGADKLKEYQVQLDPKSHEITDKTKRPDKLIETDTGSSTVIVARLPIPMQKRIVRLAAAFLCGNPIELNASPNEGIETDLLTVLKKTWDDNKLDYKSKKLAKMMMSETEVAELWYTEPADEFFWKGTPNEGKANFKLRMKIIANSLGDSLYPVFNSAGDMIAFGRGYTVQEGDKRIDHFDLYTEDKIYLASRGETGMAVTKEEANQMKKIPVIYYSQDAPEWYDVQEMIDRLERVISNLADTNDYHGSPTIKVKGSVKGFAKKGEQGKIIELEGEGADASYMSWDKSPESVKLEYESLRSLIMDMTDTPDISFDQVKGLGTFSGIALKMLFLGAHMKASDKEEIFGEVVQRRINYLKAAHCIINVKMEPAAVLTIKPKFTYYLPKNDTEMIDMLTAATSAEKPIMSRKTAVMLNPLVQNAEKELEAIGEEANASSELDKEMNS